MGLFGFDSNKTSTTVNQYDQRVAAADQATVIKGTGNLAAKDNAKVTLNKTAGDGNKVASDQAVIVTTTLGAGANSGFKMDNLKISEGGSLVIGDGGESAARLSTALVDLSKNTSDTLRDALKDNNNVVSGTVSDALKKVAAAAELQATDGDSSRNKYMLYALYGALALIALWLFTRK